MAINDIPLSWSDSLFSDNVNSGSVTIPDGGKLSNVSITETGSTASVVLRGDATLDDVRVNSREGVRIGGGGDIVINNSYIETTGTGSDHADGIQAYSPGSTGNVTISNSTIVSHNYAATAGMFIADNYGGTVTLDNVVFEGGPFGLRIHADPGSTINVALKDVFFVGPFMWAPLLIEESGGVLNITQWDNVRYATIVNGELVPGALIQPPSTPTTPTTPTGATEGADRLTGTDGNNVINALGGNDRVDGLGGTDTLGGGTGNDMLSGGLGNDSLNGGVGTDEMRGGAGNDVYVVDNASDIVNESLAGSNGVDTVQSAISFSLANTGRVFGAVEYLTLLGSANLSGTGNALNNVVVGNGGANLLTGGAGSDRLNGGAGADNMRGGAGNDVYVVDNASDIVNESLAGSNGVDTVQSAISFSLANTGRVFGAVEYLTLLGSANLSGTGNALNNVVVGNGGANLLTGGAGSDRLNGGAGADNMRGGAGNDVYVVDNASDIVNESLAGSNGVDTVQSAISFSLANTGRVFGAVEYLTLLGSANLSGTGNALNNVVVGNGGANLLTGGAGSDRLNGGAGADNMRGGAGNDVYVVDNASDIVNESLAGSNGVDTVQSAISFNLSNTTRVLGSVEKLTLLGTGNISGTGNGLNNVITGNAGANVLNGGAGADALNGGAGNDLIYGGAGNDTLTGGAGNDTFVFNAGISATTNVDTIVDFNVAQDTIRVDNAVMPGLGSYLGTLSSAAFWKSTTGLAHDSNDRIIYETDTGWLNYDSNGNAAGGAVHIAKLNANLSLSSADFFVI